MFASFPALQAQDPIFSQFFSSPLYLNPAFAGSGGGSRLALNSRAQPFVGFKTFSTHAFSYDGYFPALSGGIGLLVTSDLQSGLIVNNQVSLIYSYHLRAGENFYIQFGAQAGYHRSDFKWQDLEWAGLPEDPPPLENVHSANFAAGVLLYSETIYGGFSAHNLSEPPLDFYLNSDARLSRKYTAHIGLYLRPGRDQRLGPQPRDFFISPNVIVQHQQAFTRINYGFYAGLSPFLAGMWLRQDLTRPYTLIFLLGTEFESFRLGYSYDHSLSGFSGAMSGIHEISVSFLLGGESKKMKYRILNCPSF